MKLKELIATITQYDGEMEVRMTVMCKTINSVHTVDVAAVGITIDAGERVLALMGSEAEKLTPPPHAAVRMPHTPPRKAAVIPPTPTTSPPSKQSCTRSRQRLPSRASLPRGDG